MTGSIDTVAGLENVIGRTPPAIHLKVIDHLDETARYWIAHSPFLFAGVADDVAVAITLGGDKPGFVGTETDRLHLPLASVDHPELFHAGAGFGSLFLIPGIRETLRVNGQVAEIRGGHAVIMVEECYVHCAKAFIRSEFWSAAPAPTTSDSATELTCASRFMALATSSARHQVDVSPKGDPAGSMARIGSDGTFWFADRPGNRRADSFRNLLERPAASAVVLIPGSTRVVMVRGQARLSTDDARRDSFAVKDKIPLLAVAMDQPQVNWYDSPALHRAKLWPVETVGADIDPASMFAAHLKLNRNKGMGAKLASAVVSVPGLMRRGLEKDYKSNLY